MADEEPPLHLLPPVKSKPSWNINWPCIVILAYWVAIVGSIVAFIKFH